MLRPDEVFTLQLPLEPTNVYAERGKAETNLQKSLYRGLVPLVYGEFGVGKTSMVRYNLKDKEDQGGLVYIESAEGMDFAGVISRILEVIGYEVTRERTASSSGKVGAEVSSELSGGLSWIKAKMGGKVSASTEEGEALTKELIVTSPSDGTVIGLAERKGLALVIDELHKASDSFRNELTTFLKAYSNRSCKSFKIVLLGTTSDATALVRADPGIDRLIQEVNLPIMSNHESKGLVESGMDKLDVSISEALIDKVSKISGGSPTIVQFISLEMAEEARREESVVEESYLQNAVEEFVRTRASRLNHSYVTSVETKGPKRLRKQILHAMAQSPDEMVTMKFLVRSISDSLNEKISATALSGPLRKLKTKAFGPVLKDVQRSGSEDRVLNLNTFADPALKAFIRMRVIGEQEGVVFSDESPTAT